MRSILEQAVIHHLNGDAEKAQELFHQFIVARARQIHESMRNGEAVAEGFEDDDVVNEEFFSEDDLAKLEDEPVEDEGDDFHGEAPVDDQNFGAEDLGNEGDDDADDLGGDEGDDDADDLGGEGDEEGTEHDIEARIEDLEAELERLAAEFETLQGEEGEGDDFDDDVDTADDLDDDMADDADDMSDESGEQKFEEPVHESEDMDAGDDDDFDDIAESVVTELEKINVKMADGKEVADGSSFSQNNKSPLPQKKVGQRDGAKPTASKQSQHKGFEREAAPSVSSMKKRKNNVDSSSSALSAVSKTDKTDHKGVGTGKGGNITAKSPKSPVMPTKGTQK